MVDEMLQKIKEKLLEELISKMSDGMGDRMKPKGLGVEVQAPDSAKLAEGLDKAKDLVSGSDEKPSDEDRMAKLSDKGNVGPSTDPDDDDDDEEMMNLLSSMHKS